MDTQDKHILLLIPAFNEESTIGRVIEGVKKAAPSTPVLIIDDGSTDATSLVARAAGAAVITLPFNLGYGAALQTGYLYAVKHKYDFVVQMDADGQHDAQCVPELAGQIMRGRADVILGSRFLGAGSYKMGFVRYAGVRLFARIASLIIGQKISDPTSGFLALSSKALRFYCRNVFPSDFPDADMLILSHFAGLRIREMPVVMHLSPAGKRRMHSGFSALYYIFKMFFSILAILLRERPEKEADDAV